MIERYLIRDFIEWLEIKKRIYLMDIKNNKDRFITDGFPSNWDELEKLIEEYSQDTDV